MIIIITEIGYLSTASNYHAHKWTCDQLTTDNAFFNVDPFCIFFKKLIKMKDFVI